MIDHQGSNRAITGKQSGRATGLAVSSQLASGSPLMIDLAPEYVPSLVVAGRGEALPLTDAVARAVILMTGRRWRMLARRYPMSRYPHFRWALDGYCPGDWIGIVRAAIAEGGHHHDHCRALEPVFEGQWGYCRTCCLYYRAHEDTIYRVSGSDLARKVTE